MQCLDQINRRANLRLKKMTDNKYELRRRLEDDGSELGLDLNVKDFYTGRERNVQSLSGGEQFQASLSLALGLADEIQDSAKNYDTLEDWMKDIARYREKMEEMKAEMQFRSAEKEEERVTLATFHSAKGLEFREVFLLDVNEKIIPYKKASLETDLEEERRLFYVGMTRAKEHLHILYLKEQYNKKMEPSRFLECLREQTECRQQNPVEKQRKNGDKTVENTVEKRLKK